jgi:hypothetical protein
MEQELIEKYKGYKIMTSDNFYGDLEILDKYNDFCDTAQSIETAHHKIDKWKELEKQDK